MVGGSFADFSFGSTEYFTAEGQTYSGPTLPEPVDSMCFVKLDSSTALLIGGMKDWDFLYNTTYWFDIDSQVFSNGPRLRETRQGHSCGVLLLDGLTYVLVVSGSDRDNNFRNTEHFRLNVDSDFQDNLFPILPVEHLGSQV